jgi:hypothetical protein
MKRMKTMLPSGGNKMLFVVTFILGLLPFSGQNNSVAAQRAQPVKTELVIVKKTPLKNLVNVSRAADRILSDDHFNLLNTLKGLSSLHTRLATTDNCPLDNSRRRSCQLKLPPASDDDSSKS